MSKDTELKEASDKIIEEVKESPTPHVNSQLELKEAGDSPSALDSSASDIESLKSITQDLLKVAKAQTDTIAAQKQEITQLKEQLSALNTDYQNSKPLDRRAEVVGFFDFGKQKQIFNGERFESEREYAAKLFRDLDMEFPVA